MSDHEAHGHCAECGYPAHRYPFGWQHVGTGMYSCPQITPVPTCCDEHARDASVVVPEVGPPASGTATRAARTETGPHGAPAVAAGPHPFRLIHPAGGSGCAPST